LSVSSFQPSKSSSAQPSSIETIGKAAQAGQVVDHAGRIERLALAFQLVLAVLEELGRGDVEAQDEVVPAL
jgi:hypothetical protein